MAGLAAKYNLIIQNAGGVTGRPRALTAGADNPYVHDRLLTTTGSVLFRPAGLSTM